MGYGEQIASVLQQVYDWATDNPPVIQNTHRIMQIAVKCAYNNGEIYVFPKKAYKRAQLLLGKSYPDLSKTSLRGEQGMVLVEVDNYVDKSPTAVIIISDDTPHPSQAIPFDIAYGENPDYTDQTYTDDLTPFFSDEPQFCHKLVTPIDYQNNYANTVMWMVTGPYWNKLTHLPLASWEKTK